MKAGNQHRKNAAFLSPRKNSEIKEIRKTKQLSKEPCVEGKSWVAGETGITVRDGCQAEFTILYRLIGVSERKDQGRQLPTPSYPQAEFDDEFGECSCTINSGGNENSIAIL